MADARGEHWPVPTFDWNRGSLKLSIIDRKNCSSYFLRATTWFKRKQRPGHVGYRSYGVSCDLLPFNRTGRIFEMK
jgi:hypothetical protein